MIRSKVVPTLVVLIVVVLLPALWMSSNVFFADYLKEGRQLLHDRNVPVMKMPHKEDVDLHSLLESKKIKVNQCEVIHIAVVCMDLTSVQRVGSMLKSIYMTRQNPIYFHFFTYKSGEKLLSVLMETWDVAEVTWTINVIIPKKLAEWIKRDFSLLKMKIYRLLPQVEKVIVLDPSYLVHCDIKELWRVFDEFNSSQVIATTGIPKANPIIESKTNPYVYDFGVALLYLQRLREDDVVAMLDLEMQKFFFYSKSYLFAKEKEILEIVLRDHTDLVFNLPCKWNVQLNDEESFCFATESSDFMIINWYAPLSTIPHKEYLESLRDEVYETNSNLLRKKTTVCYDTQRPVVQVSNHSCWAYNKQAQRNYRTQLFFWGRNTSIDSEEFEVTLVSHFGGESLSLLDTMAFHWSGPMSLTAFLTDQEVIIFKMAIQISTYLKKRRNVVFNLVIKNGPTYPVEYLERVAFEQATTAYVFMTDFDNLPMKAIYGDLRAHVTRAGIEQMKKTALVVPGYISKLHRTQQPWTIVKLREQMALGEYAASNNLLKEGSLSLDYLSHSDGQSNNNSWQYAFEWSIVVPRLFVKQSFDRYKEHFYFGKYSRQALIAELYAAGYLFAPLHDLFVLRMPHSRTEIQMKPEDHKLWERCLSWNWMEYLKTVSRDYDVKVERLLKVFPLSSEME